MRYGFVLFLLFAAYAKAQIVTYSSTGLSVAVDVSGTYTIHSTNPAWTFRGDTGQPLANLQENNGQDQIGAYQDITFEYNSGGQRQASIRNYSAVPAVIFTVTYEAAAVNTAPFPTFLDHPAGLSHLTYSGQFARPNFVKLGNDSPWVLFDTTGNTFILSSASHFMVASIETASDSGISGGISPKIKTLPGGLTQKTILVIGERINAAFETWGGVLQQLYGKTQTVAGQDVSLQYLGYWTDAGSGYYYEFADNKSYEDTLLAIRDEYANNGVPLGYMQLDSWFYPKGGNGDWTDRVDGIYEYVAAPALFPNGLKTFQQLLGLPLITHARWIDSKSPYRQKYKMSGNVAIDQRYWDDIAGYLQASGVVTYEQDWLEGGAHTDFTLNDGETFLNSMAAGMAKQGLTLQYCMPGPRHMLQSVTYGNLKTMRTSLDRFDGNRWTSFLYASRLASAVGAWPFADAFRSAEFDNLLLATLSAGPVGVSDRLGSVNAPNLLLSVRPDGRIVKPDVPIVPLDQTYLNDAGGRQAPMMAATYTDFGAWKAFYVFGYTREANLPATFAPTELGIGVPVFVYNYLTHTGRIAGPAEIISEPMAGDRAYYIVVPFGNSGIAFLGDRDQLVPLGKERISQVTDDGTAVEAQVAFAPGEGARTLQGYARRAPSVTAVKGAAGAVSFDPSTQIFTVPVTAASDGSAVVRIQLKTRLVCLHHEPAAGFCREYPVQ